MDVKKSKIKVFIVSFAIYFALNARYSIDNTYNKMIPYNGGWFFSSIINNIKKMEFTLGEYSFNSIFSLLFIYIIYSYLITKIKKQRTNYEKIPALLFSFFMVLGNSFKLTNSWNLIFLSKFNVVVSCIVYFGYYNLFAIIIQLIELIMESRFIKESKLRNNDINKFIFDKKPFIIPWGIILLAWMPYLIAKFPGAMCYDAYNQINQFFGYREFTTHHPPFHTILIGICVKFGQYMNWINIGLFIYILLQTLMLSAILAYTIKYVAKWNVSYLYRIFMLIIYCISPLYPMYATTCIKDVVFVIFFIPYIITLIEIVDKSAIGLMKSWYIIVCNSILSLFLMLTRNNGLYLIFPTVIVTLIYLYKIIKNKKIYMYFALILISPLIIFQIYSISLQKIFNIKHGSIREALSIPFQQTARYARDFEKDVTEDEKIVIDKVLDYEKIAKVYNPDLSDPVKGTFKECTKDELVDYFKIWSKQLVRHPSVYVQATINNCYGYFYPGVKNTVYYNSLKTSYKNSNIVFEQPKKLEDARMLITEYAKLISDIPIINLVENVGIYTWIIILLINFTLKRKMYTYLIPLIPLTINVLVCIAAPAFFGNPRYAFPVMFSTIMLMGIYFNILKNSIENNK